MAYNSTAKWIKGKKNDAPDALSCNPASDPENGDTLAELDTNDHPDMSFAEIRTLHGDTTETSDYKTFGNMQKKTWSISSCSISFYKDSLPTEINP